jgi:hypothetical protein
MKKHDRPILDGRKDTSGLPELRDVVYGSGETLEEKKKKKKTDQKKRIDE